MQNEVGSANNDIAVVPISVNKNRERLIYWGTLLAVALLLFFRKPDALLNPQFWAEDGKVFFQEQYRYGASAIFHPYSDYLLVLPRLIAWLAAVLFPIAALPTVYNYATFLMTILVIADIFSPRLHLKYKPLYALAVVLVPHFGNEIFLTLTNFQWVLALSLPLLLLKAEPDRQYGNLYGQYLHDAATVLFCGLTGPFALLTLPLFAIKWYLNKSHYSAFLLIGMVLVSGTQFFFLLSGIPNNGGWEEHTGHLLAFLVGYRLCGDLYVGRPQAELHGSPPLLITLFGAILLFFIESARQEKKNLRPIGVFLYLMFVIFLGTVSKYRASLHELVPVANGTRYFFLPFVLQLWALILCLDTQKRWQRVIAALLICATVFASLTTAFYSPPLPDLHWYRESRRIGKEAHAHIPINPNGWYISIP